MKIEIQGHLTTLCMVLFWSSLEIRHSTHGRLYKCGCNWSALGKETNSTLDTFTEQTIFDFLLTISSHTRPLNQTLDSTFLGPKQPICPNENFFRKSVNKPCSFHEHTLPNLLLLTQHNPQGISNLSLLLFQIYIICLHLTQGVMLLIW